MSGTDLDASEFLGRDAARVVDGIADPEVRQRVLQAITICDDALEVVDALDLTPHELSVSDQPSLALWNHLAPDIRSLLLVVQRAGAQLLELYPPPPDQELTDTSSLDLEIDLLDALDDDPQEDLPELIRDRREHELDAIVGGASSERTIEKTGRGISALAGMLQSDFVSFGQRLRSHRVVGDHWFLLAELQEMRQKCSQCLEAVVATVLRAFTDEDLEVVLPRYQTAARRAQRVRAAIVDLEHDVTLLNEQAKAGGLGDLVAIRTALVFRLSELAEHPVYDAIRPLDRREIIRFRLELNEQPVEEASAGRLRHAIEGFAKFLELMRSINDREMLPKTDRAAAQAIRMLLESEEDVAEARDLLEQLYGRDPRIDVFVRALRGGSAVDSEALLEAIIAVDERLRNGGPSW